MSSALKAIREATDEVSRAAAIVAASPKSFCCRFKAIACTSAEDRDGEKFDVSSVSITIPAPLYFKHRWYQTVGTVTRELMKNRDMLLVECRLFSGQIGERLMKALKDEIYQVSIAAAGVTSQRQPDGLVIHSGGTIYELSLAPARGPDKALNPQCKIFDITPF